MISVFFLIKKILQRYFRFLTFVFIILLVFMGTSMKQIQHTNAFIAQAIVQYQSPELVVCVEHPEKNVQTLGLLCPPVATEKYCSIPV